MKPRSSSPASGILPIVMPDDFASPVYSDTTEDDNSSTDYAPNDDDMSADGDSLSTKADNGPSADEGFPTMAYIRFDDPTRDDHGVSWHQPATQSNPPPEQSLWAPDYSSSIDPTLMIHPDQAIDELRRAREKIERRNAIIDANYELNEQKLCQKVTEHKEIIAELASEKASLQYTKQELEVALGFKHILGTQMSLLSREYQQLMEKLRVAEGTGKVYQVQRLAMATEKEGIKTRWMEDQKVMAKWKDDLKAQLGVWVAEKAHLLGKIKALETEKQSLIKGQ